MLTKEQTKWGYDNDDNECYTKNDIIAIAWISQWLSCMFDLLIDIWIDKCVVYKNHQVPYLMIGNANKC